MNFNFHTMFDAKGNILRVHYKSVKRDVTSVRYLGEVRGLFFHARVKHFFLFTTTVKKL